MNWKRIPKEASIPPTYGSYSDWKPQLSVEGFHQCVYCCISETSFGGVRNFHVEHYKPKGLLQFKVLENDYFNLFYACAICNSFKSDDWPKDPDNTFSFSCYPDPSKINYCELFSVNEIDGLISGQNNTGIYLINRLYLNRPQLIIDRKENFIEEKYQILISRIHMQKEKLFSFGEGGDSEALKFLKELDGAISNLNTTYHEKDKTIPYTDNQTKK
jgi:hypothetical protein